jgi:saposin
MNKIFIAIAIALAIAAPVQSGAVCNECQLVVGAVEQWAFNNATVSQMEASLEQLCSQVPGFVTICDQVVEYGVPYVVQLLENAESPAKACQQLGLCSAKSNNKLVVQPTLNLGASLQCAGCEYLVGAVESWVASGATVSKIEKDLDQVCEKVPGFAKTCEQFVGEVPKLLKYLESAENATVVCQQLQLCSKSKNVNGKVKIIAKPVKNDNVECGGCKVVVGYFLNEVNKNPQELKKAEQQVEKLFCVNTFGSAFQQTCDKLAQDGYQWLSNLKSYTPAQVCTKYLQVC